MGVRQIEACLRVSAFLQQLQQRALLSSWKRKHCTILKDVSTFYSRNDSILVICVNSCCLYFSFCKAAEDILGWKGFMDIWNIICSYQVFKILSIYFYNWLVHGIMMTKITFFCCPFSVLSFEVHHHSEVCLTLGTNKYRKTVVPASTITAGSQ